MKIVEMREKNNEELSVIADDLRAKIHQTQCDVAMNKSKTVSDIRSAKKELARVLTVINEKSLNV
jgi:ribosomal protein L29